MTAHTHTSIPSARAARVPRTPTPQRSVSPVTGGKRVAFLTAGGLVLVVAMGLMPVLGQLAG
ncbi:hypothetical protein ES689_14345 [Frigoribacterium sp. ACAM 257]|uniref:hypothetical protein n=1 Tax=Frigoribacterium sp. ACAM 257 TaxID=2508998 RepID=UPI0011BA2340|nr:hypothetical protein [Frigoribacterium sp. ACAM 257]TWX35019.1 hypothetical protein ES689_14345 [Frigoribacterium sp. ACAM 257]